MTVRTVRRGISASWSGRCSRPTADSIWPSRKCSTASTIWFSEIHEPVARVFAHHWPVAPNLGDITGINRNDAPPVDVLCGGFPCLNVEPSGVILTRRVSIELSACLHHPSARSCARS
nr:DNA cytosine methyltransferase [Flexivirga caeni]